MVKFFKKISPIVIILILIFFLYQIKVFNFFDIIFDEVVLKITRISSNASQFFKPVFIKKELIRENEDLKDKILTLQKEIVDLKITESENKILREQLHFLKTKRYNVVSVNIIGQRKELGYQWFILDQGANKGIQIDCPVIDSHGYLVGKITKVEDEQAFVTPILDSHFLTTVDFLSKSNQKSDKSLSGLAQGRYGLSIEINYIPLDYNIQKGDYLITSGLETNIPRGLIIGEIQDIQMEPAMPFQKVTVKPFVLINDLRVVGVIIP